MTPTPIPQPASYWVNLLNELTCGLIEFKFIKSKRKYADLFSFLYNQWNIKDVDEDFKECMLDLASYISSGQPVYDAAIRAFYEDTGYRFQMTVERQVALHLLCIGIDGLEVKPSDL